MKRKMPRLAREKLKLKEANKGAIAKSNLASPPAKNLP